MIPQNQTKRREAKQIGYKALLKIMNNFSIMELNPSKGFRDNTTQIIAWFFR
jgi:hypothetical protein